MVLQEEPKHAGGNQDREDARDPEEHRGGRNPWAQLRKNELLKAFKGLEACSQGRIKRHSRFQTRLKLS